MYKISNLKAPIDFSESKTKALLGKYYNKPKEFFYNEKIIKKSLDARKKNDIHYVLTVAFDCKINLDENAETYCEDIIRIEDLPLKKVNSDVLPTMIVGSGPSGLFAALTLLTFGEKVILIERGEKIEERIKSVENLNNFGILNEESNIQYGEGGAGTFSDGKLNSGIKSPYINLILNEFVEFGAPKDVLYISKPHIGTDYLQTVVKNIRKKILSLGGEIRYNTKLVDIIISNGRIHKAVIFNNGKETIEIENLILATGHSAYETYETLYNRGVKIEQKPFSMGVRIEHLQSDINLSQYGTTSDELPPAEYKIAAHLKNRRSAYTFCMCPGGEVVCSSSDKGIVTNGMSKYKRDGKNANSAVLINVTPQDFLSEHPLAGYEFKNIYEKRAYNLTESFSAPISTVGDFLKGKTAERYGKVMPTYRPSVNFTNLQNCLPSFVYESLKFGIIELDKKLKGFADPEAILTGIETRSSSPIRVLRDQNYVSNIEGLYPIGEGAGYAGGIMSSANDGIMMAINYLKKKIDI